MQKEEVRIKKIKQRSLVALAHQASLAELRALVEELALRRKKMGLSIIEYGPQEQLKHLIYLIHRYGDNGDFEGEANLQLLSDLKRASFYIRKIRPRGYLNFELLDLNLSWGELLEKFKVKLAQKETINMLQERLPNFHGYLELQRLLYFAYAWNERKFFRGMTASRYLINRFDLRRLASNPACLQHLNQLVCCLTGPIPLLPLHGEKWLLSPELLYDHLLEMYIELDLNYRSYSQYTMVAEDKLF